ncbi:hypothetical protein FD755_009242, partial [Muntiacus reevesi]
ARNQLRGQKSRNVFHVASQKNFRVKNKAKPVTTNLKKINIKKLANFPKSLSIESLKKQLISQQCRENVPQLMLMRLQN